MGDIQEIHFSVPVTSVTPVTSHVLIPTSTRGGGGRPSFYLRILENVQKLCSFVVKK